MVATESHMSGGTASREMRKNRHTKKRSLQSRPPPPTLLPQLPPPTLLPPPQPMQIVNATSTTKSKKRPRNPTKHMQSTARMKKLAAARNRPSANLKNYVDGIQQELNSLTMDHNTLRDQFEDLLTQSQECRDHLKDMVRLYATVAATVKDAYDTDSLEKLQSIGVINSSPEMNNPFVTAPFRRAQAFLGSDAVDLSTIHILPKQQVDKSTPFRNRRRNTASKPRRTKKRTSNQRSKRR